ncbi:hypothetical protein N0V84_011416 [Fusarium piperis]|uniref:Uncharacterized protein n=1 Tax=Fusarium piperis TaxID=1435070 RepID=A0A9W8TDF6_9HYPO|nr:hypothetical protein N0V84_011416 [Fusarium piperis]
MADQGSPPPDGPSTADWVSATSSVLAAVIALVTLFTVYVAALQLISQRRKNRHGLSSLYLGPWRSKVVSSSSFKLQTTISAPTSKWQPKFVFPTGFERTFVRRKSILDVEKATEVVLPRANWVTFLQSLGLTPETDTLYDMQFESELIGGTVPMRWRGPDLAAICSMLGFQIPGERAEFREPMPLPTIWSGPLGYLQFRAGFEGCVVEFCRRNLAVHQLGSRFHRHYQGQFVTESMTPQLCHSVGTFCVEKDGRKTLFYIGEAMSDTWLEFICSNLDTKPNARKNDNSKAPDGQETPTTEDGASIDAALRELETASMTSDQILEKVWGLPPKREKPTAGPEAAGVRSELLDNIIEEVQKKEQRKKNLRTIIEPSPGLLSVLTIGELVASRGFPLSDCIEYHRLLVHTSDVDKKAYPFSLGDFRMDRDGLELMRNAILNIKPHGFYFSPGDNLASDLNDIYDHVRSELRNRAHFFPGVAMASWQGNPELYWGAELLNEMQRLRLTAQTTFSVEDMGILSHAVARVLSACDAARHVELVWAMIVCPDLFTHLAKFGRTATADEFTEFLRGSVRTGKERMDTSGLPHLSKNERQPGDDNDDNGEEDIDDNISSNTEAEDGRVQAGQYAVPLCLDGDYSAVQLLGAFIDVCLRYCWIEKSWRTNVQHYGAAIPPTVLMF